jgi:hypothetical protein
VLPVERREASRLSTCQTTLSGVPGSTLRACAGHAHTVTASCNAQCMTWEAWGCPAVLKVWNPSYQACLNPPCAPGHVQRFIHQALAVNPECLGWAHVMQKIKLARPEGRKHSLQLFEGTHLAKACACARPSGNQLAHHACIRAGEPQPEAHQRHCRGERDMQ